MPNNNQKQPDIMDLLIWLAEKILGTVELVAYSTGTILNLEKDKSARQKKKNGKGDWVLQGEQFEKAMTELGKELQENIKNHSSDENKPEEAMTEEERKYAELRNRMMEEVGEMLNMDPKKGIRTKQQFQKYQELREFFTKDNLNFQKKNLKDLKDQKKDAEKQLEEQRKNDPKNGNGEKQPDDAEKEAALQALLEEYEKDIARLEALTAEQEKALQDRRERSAKEEELAKEAEEQRKQDEDRKEDEKEEEREEERKEEQAEEEKDEARENQDRKNIHYQGAVKGVANAVGVAAGGEVIKGALKKDEQSPFALDKETMLQEQELMKKLLNENIRLRSGSGEVILNAGADNMNPEQQMHAKNEQEARRFIDMDPEHGISDKEAYEAFMDVKEYFMEQNISHVKAAMTDNLSRQEALRASMQRENEQQRMEDKDDAAKKNDSAVKPEVRKNERDVAQEVRKNEQKQEELKKDDVRKVPERRRGPAVNPPGIRREHTNYRELEREVREEDRLLRQGGKPSAMERMREQMRKQKEREGLKKPKVKTTDELDISVFSPHRKHGI